MLSTTYDAQADALYISIRRGNVARTQHLDDWTLVDEDAHGTALGVEVLHPVRDWPLTEFLNHYRIAGPDRQLLEELFPPLGTGRQPGFRASVEVSSH